MEMQNGASRKCNVPNIDIHRAAFVKTLKVKGTWKKKEFFPLSFLLNPTNPTKLNKKIKSKLLRERTNVKSNKK